MESGFPFTFNFATLNLDKNQSLYFMSHKILMNFVENLKLLLIFEVFNMKTPINCKIY
jgi:hypothetical protein